ncbi:hypothetical protein ACIS_00161 [Anaplasma centrale str. Israel]|uniref:Uncharacterized protein n=1 Tax=Anaplasma centrale (strain Israel) TaxID=574556 RepID=D1ATH1_ANACI|nr:hypothetical protein [Anaplasma centrale]ACZ48849.1 hypothetical protein ACIS_00161 [Anaplasma centrale str. Israel]
MSIAALHKKRDSTMFYLEVTMIDYTDFWGFPAVHGHGTHGHCDQELCYHEPPMYPEIDEASVALLIEGYKKMQEAHLRGAILA